MNSSAWQRISAEVHPGCKECGRVTVYWRRYVEGGWLAATKLRSAPGDRNRWHWTWYERLDHGLSIVVAEGAERTVEGARRAAEKAVRERQIA